MGARFLQCKKCWVRFTPVGDSPRCEHCGAVYNALEARAANTKTSAFVPMRLKIPCRCCGGLRFVRLYSYVYETYICKKCGLSEKYHRHPTEIPMGPEHSADEFEVMPEETKPFR